MVTHNAQLAVGNLKARSDSRINVRDCYLVLR